MALHRGLKYLCLAALSLVAATLWSTTLSAALIVNDTWQDADRTNQENGVDTDLDTDTESAWFNGGASTMTASVGNLNKDLTGTSANWTTYFATEGSEVNLANQGDKLRVTWTFVLTGVAANNTSQNFRLGVVDSVAVNRIAADGNPGSGTALNPYAGYAIFANMSATALGNSNPFQVRDRVAQGGSNAILGTSGDWGNGDITGTLNGATAGNGGFAAGTPYTLVWELTRNGAGIDIDATMSGQGYNTSGVGTIDASDPTGNGFKFDTFNVRPSSAVGVAEAFDSKLFRVEFIPGVPEPSTFVLMGLAGIVGGLLRRR
jgi:hypothetical protein